MQIVPSKNEILKALPGLIFLIFPIAVISELVYWIESWYVESVFHIPAPVIAIMIAAVISIVVTNFYYIPERYSSGLQFSSRWLLRIGIVLYGFNFSYILWLQPGASWIFAIGLLAV
ncbi:MAG: putative sulfate exporter family transporter, partial [Rhabdochlamydiaceae bacterium]